MNVHYLMSSIFIPKVAQGRPKSTIQFDYFISYYPTGQNHSLELMFAKFATANKIAKDLNPLKLIANRCKLPENNNEDVSLFSNGSPH